MKVKELIDVLQKIHGNPEVTVSMDGEVSSKIKRVFSFRYSEKDDEIVAILGYDAGVMEEIPQN